MSDGAEIFGPDEGGGGAVEELSEDAKQRFAAAAAARKQIRKDEKKSKQKDDQVAHVIVKFLGSKQHTHLFVLISRLVARDCPSIFILAILSLIDEESNRVVVAYLAERSDSQSTEQETALAKNDALDVDSNRLLMAWVAHLQQVLALDPEGILRKLMLDEKNIDGTVLQLTSFVIQEFLAQRNKEAPFEKVQPLTASILQTVIEPYLGKVRKLLLEERAAAQSEDED